MDLFQLETFLTVAQERSFSRAATKLRRTQPAVSQVIRKLEESLAEPLFDRSSRDGTLTDAGLLLQEYAQKLLNLRADAQGALVELRQMHRGRLNIAANEFTCQYLLPLLDDFRHRCPMIKVAVQRSLASRIPDDLLGHGTELGILGFKPEDSRLRSIVVYRDELAFIVNPQHALARVKSAHIQQLGVENFVAHNVPSPYRVKVIQAFKRYKTPLNMSVELPTIEAIKTFVAMGNGVALVPKICVQRELNNGELVHVPVRELQFERKLRLVHRKGASLSHAARAFLDVAQSFTESKGGAYLFHRET
ncbi:MAG: transcriptional regulator [Candidatus Acidoferrum typicum]|nr:transcriptional regulator [Candidatus Acidoferrum typicum]